MQVTTFSQIQGIGCYRLVRGREGLGLREVIEVSTLGVLPSLLSTLGDKDLSLDVPSGMNAVVKSLQSLGVVNMPVKHEVPSSLGEGLDEGLLGITVHLNIKLTFKI